MLENRSYGQIWRWPIHHMAEWPSGWQRGSIEAQPRLRGQGQEFECASRLIPERFPRHSGAVSGATNFARNDPTASASERADMVRYNAPSPLGRRDLDHRRG